MPTSLADKHYSFDIPSHLLFQSPLSRGITPNRDSKVKFEKTFKIYLVVLIDFPISFIVLIKNKLKLCIRMRYIIKNIISL